jgi:vacuolar-type H+-ATPase subunit H
MSGHKTNCNNEKNNYPVYRFIRDHGGFNNWSVVKIRDVSCKDKYDLAAEERKEFELLGATLNSYYPHRSIKEYREENKQRSKEWREDNDEKIREYLGEYREKNKEKIKEQRKTHYEKNKKEIIQRVKVYYDENKEKLKEKKKEKVQCECGSIVTKGNLATHKKTQKHQNWEKTLQDN